MRCLKEEDGSKRQTFGTPRHRFGERRFQRRAFGNAAKALRPPVQPVPSAKRLANLHLRPPGCSSLMLLPNVWRARSLPCRLREGLSDRHPVRKPSEHKAAACQLPNVWV